MRTGRRSRHRRPVRWSSGRVGGGAAGGEALQAVDGVHGLAGALTGFVHDFRLWLNFRRESGRCYHKAPCCTALSARLALQLRQPRPHVHGFCHEAVSSRWDLAGRPQFNRTQRALRASR